MSSVASFGRCRVVVLPLLMQLRRVRKQPSFARLPCSGTGIEQRACVAFVPASHGTHPHANDDLVAVPAASISRHASVKRSHGTEVRWTLTISRKPERSGVDVQMRAGNVRYELYYQSATSFLALICISCIYFAVIFFFVR
jgi:hypothetical protein